MAITDYDFYQTRNDIIQRAFQLVGALADGEVMSAEEEKKGKVALNQIVKSWQGKNVFLWNLETVTVATVAGTVSYVLPLDPPILYVERAFTRDANNIDTELEIVKWIDYPGITDKQTGGTPYALSIDHRASPTAYLYPPPIANGTLILFCYTTSKDWDVANGPGDFPVEFTQALTYELAHNLSHIYGLPIGERREFRDIAREEFTMLTRIKRDRGTNEVVCGAYK